MSCPLSHLPWIRNKWFLSQLRAAGKAVLAARAGSSLGIWQQPQAGLSQENVATGGNSYRLALQNLKTLPQGTPSGKFNCWILKGG